jgi:predicted Holliday junction resolvase-like endonuclease
MDTLEMAFGLLGMIIFFSFIVVMKVLGILSRAHIRHIRDVVQLKNHEKVNDLKFKTQVVVHVTGSVKNSESAAQITNDIEEALKDIIKDIDVSVKVRVEKID